MGSGEQDMRSSGTHDARANEAVFKERGTRAVSLNDTTDASKKLGEVLQAVTKASQGLSYAWKERAYAAEDKATAAVEELRVAKAELAECQYALKEYRGQGGIVNMDRSWKTKYRNALAEANERLFDAGLEQVRIRKGTEDHQPKVFESEQLKILLSQGSDGQGDL